MTRNALRTASGPRLARAYLLTCLLLVALLGCLQPSRTPAPPTEARRTCLPSFPDGDGWYGGDGAFSIPLPDGAAEASLWLFGDSFVERPDSPGRRAYPYVSNTLGRSTCSPHEGFQLERHWHRDAEGRPLPFFAPPADAAWVTRARAATGRDPWYWPFGGLVLDGRLHVALLRVVAAAPRGPLRLPFDAVGMDIARIADPSAPPETWQIEIASLSDDALLLPAGGFVESDGHVVAFAFFDREAGSEGLALVRWPRDVFLGRSGDPRIDREILGEDGRWKRRLESTRAAIVLRDPATELSLHFDAGSRTWIAVTLPPTPVDDAPVELVVWRAPRLTGPWTEARRFRVEAPTHAAPGPGEPFCYAGKAHPQLSTPYALRATYVCNLAAPSAADELPTLRQLARSPDLYRPIAVEIPISSSSSPGVSAIGVAAAAHASSSRSGAGSSTSAIAGGGSDSTSAAGGAGVPDSASAPEGVGTEAESAPVAEGVSGGAVLRPR